MPNFKMSMTIYGPLLLACLIRLISSENSTTVKKPLVLSGHYINWPSRKTQEKFFNDKKFIPQNIIFSRFQFCVDRVFLVAPRYKHGVPFTVGYVPLNNHEQFYNYVKPFPKMEILQDTEYITNGVLINVIDLVMGEDGIIWVLDIGISGTLSDHPSKEENPKVVGFDAATGKIEYKICLRSLISDKKTRLQYMVVENVIQGETVLYLGDGGTRSIIVWSVQNNEGFRVKLPYFILQGSSTDPLDDVFYVALVENENGNYLYITYLSSLEIFRIKTSDLQRLMNTKCVVNIGTKPSEMIFLGVGYGSILYFRFRGKNQLLSWDTTKSFLEENFKIVRKNKDCRLVTHVDVDNDGILWVLESNIQDFIADHVGSYGPSMSLTPIIEDPKELETYHHHD